MKAIGIMKGAKGIKRNPIIEAKGRNFNISAIEISISPQKSVDLAVEKIIGDVEDSSTKKNVEQNGDLERDAKKVVPDLYKCTLSRLVMSDPMLIVEAGQLYYRSSIPKLDEKSLENRHIEPMADLKYIIQQFISNNNIQLEEIPEEQYDTSAEYITIAQNALQFDFQSFTNRYQKQLEKVKKQNDIRSETLYQVQGCEDYFESVVTAHNKSEYTGISCLYVPLQSKGYLLAYLHGNLDEKHYQ